MGSGHEGNFAEQNDPTNVLGNVLGNDQKSAHATIGSRESFSRRSFASQALIVR
jgi:hypothetical protein